VVNDHFTGGEKVGAFVEKGRNEEIGPWERACDEFEATREMEFDRDRITSHAGFEGKLRIKETIHEPIG
jgi:hypothetical protein